MAFNPWRKRCPCRCPRNKDREVRVELIRVIQSAGSDTDNVIVVKVVHMVDLRVDEQTAAAASTESTTDRCTAVCDHIVASRRAAAQFERASRTTDNEDFVGTGKILAIPTIAEVFTGGLSRELVDYLPTSAAS